jgi:hypothetical protein
MDNKDLDRWLELKDIRGRTKEQRDELSMLIWGGIDELLVAEIRRLREAVKWIPIKGDNYPKEYVSVLVTEDFQNYDVAMLAPDTPDSTYEWTCDFEPTHWMPLPAQKADNPIEPARPVYEVIDNLRTAVENRDDAIKELAGMYFDKCASTAGVPAWVLAITNVHPSELTHLPEAVQQALTLRKEAGDA